MNIYTGLLFNQGHLQDPALARSLARAQEQAPPDAGGRTGEAAAAEPQAAVPRVRRGRGWVELQAALLSAFR